MTKFWSMIMKRILLIDNFYLFRIGYLYTYWGPLGFVIFVTMVREAIDDFKRWQRDREVNQSRSLY